MGFWLLMLAATLSLVAVFLQGVIGARIYLSDINNSNLEQRIKSLSLLSWRMLTIFLLIGAATFAAVAFNLITTIATYPLIAIYALGSIMIISFALAGHKELFKLPGAYMMGTIAVCGYFGVTWLG